MDRHTLVMADLLCDGQNGPELDQIREREVSEPSKGLNRVRKID